MAFGASWIEVATSSSNSCHRLTCFRQGLVGLCRESVGLFQPLLTLNLFSAAILPSSSVIMKTSVGLLRLIAIIPRRRGPVSPIGVRLAPPRVIIRPPFLLKVPVVVLLIEPDGLAREPAMMIIRLISTIRKQGPQGLASRHVASRLATASKPSGVDSPSTHSRRTRRHLRARPSEAAEVHRPPPQSWPHLFQSSTLLESRSANGLVKLEGHVHLPPLPSTGLHAEHAHALLAEELVGVPRTALLLGRATAGCSRWGPS